MDKLTWHTEKRKVKELVPWEHNPRKLTEAQAEQLDESLDKFDLVEIPAINTNNMLVAGHQRVYRLMVKGRGEEEIDVRVPNRTLSDEEFKEYNIRSNKNTGEWDWARLALMEREMIAKLGFDAKELQKMLTKDEKDSQARQTLASKFIIPPFSVLDSRAGTWQERKKAWMQLTGVLSETRENVLFKSASGADPQYYPKKETFEKFLGKTMSNEEFEQKYYIPAFINGGVSVFDPVLTEVMYTWFVPKNGRVLDPFMGDQAKAIVAGELKLEYTGVDIRADQIESNKKACSKYKGMNFYAGDANNIDKIVPDANYDFIFTCPPYYDLEVYSKEDMSALGTYEEFMTQYKNVFKKAIEKLNDNRFVIVVIGEIRNKKTGEYRNFVGDNIRIFQELGLHYYNEIILVTSTGSLATRTPKQFNENRKIGKTHQNVLAFYKGEAKKLFNENQALLATHQNILTFFKGDINKVAETFGPVILKTDMELLDNKEEI